MTTTKPLDRDTFQTRAVADMHAAQTGPRKVPLSILTALLDPDMAIPADMLLDLPTVILQARMLAAPMPEAGMIATVLLARRLDELPQAEIQALRPGDALDLGYGITAVVDPFDGGQA